MHEAGFAAVSSMDYSDSVISEMRAKTSGKFGMVWETMDVTEMRYDDVSWPLVMDKGTLDALYAENTTSLGKVAEQMLCEIQRVLAPGGHYALITMAQEFVLAKVLLTFSPPHWNGTIDIQPFFPSDGTTRSACVLLLFVGSCAAYAG